MGAKTPSESVRDAVIYQINPRVFTEAGTLAAAEEFLPEVAATGADIVYLCTFVEADDDPCREHWSLRQKLSCRGNPRNPYRIRDYFRIDPEYGTSSDAASFVKKAHSLGLKVMFDLVYMHAGPGFGKLHPEFVKRDAAGNPLLNSYHFCTVDFDSQALREHLWDNMEYLVREFDADAFRCDVGGAVPLDFWIEGRRRVEKLKPGFLMLDECEIIHRKDDQDEAFDINYCQCWTQHSFPDIFLCGMPAVSLRIAWREAHDAAPGAAILRAFEHHDTANDMYCTRIEKAATSAGAEAAYVLCFLIDGVPFLYNGCEHCDTNRHSIFARKGEFVIDRSRNPVERTRFLRGLAALHRGERALRYGETHWLDTDAPETVLAFVRETEGEAILCAVNLSGGAVRAVCPGAEHFSGGTPLLERGAKRNGNLFEFAPYGFSALKKIQP